MADPEFECKSDCRAWVSFRIPDFILKKLNLKVKNTCILEAAHNFYANNHSGGHEIGVSDCLVIQNRVDLLEGKFSGS